MQTEFAMTPPAEKPLWVDVSHLVTEDDTPVDNPFSEKQMRLLTHPLYASWNPGVPFVAMANVGLYFALNAPVLVPDTLVSVGVELPPDIRLKEHRAYFSWLYGKSPDVVVEIVSNREGGELDRKMRGYAYHGVPYYAVFDPDLLIQPVRLQCYRLRHPGHAAKYEAVSDTMFEGAELGLVEWEGTFEHSTEHWVRWVDKEGHIILTAEERAAKSDARAARSDARAAWSDAQAARSDARAAALEEKLRALGADPDAI